MKRFERIPPVSFVEDGAVVDSCGAVPLARGAATGSVPFAKSGSVAVTATYTDDPNFTGSTDSRTHEVNTGTAPLSLSSATPVAVAGVTYGATMIETSGSGFLSGSVSFTGNGGVIASCQNLTLVAGGASCADQYTSGGTCSLVASHGSDANLTENSSSLSRVDLGEPFFSGNSMSVTPGPHFSFPVTALGPSAPRFSISGTLPHGVSFGAATAVLSGNSNGNTSRTFALDVDGH